MSPTAAGRLPDAPPAPTLSHPLACWPAAGDRGVALRLGPLLGGGGGDAHRDLRAAAPLDGRAGGAGDRGWHPPPRPCGAERDRQPAQPASRPDPHRPPRHHHARALTRVAARGAHLVARPASASAQRQCDPDRRGDAGRARLARQRRGRAPAGRTAPRPRAPGRAAQVGAQAAGSARAARRRPDGRHARGLRDPRQTGRAPT